MALALCLTLLPAAALAADGAQAADSTGHTHTGATELRMDGETLKKGGTEWTAKPIEVWGTGDQDKETAYALTTGTYYLGSNIEITQHPIMITGDVTLCLNGKKITCGSQAPDCVIGVYAYTASTLTLTDCGDTGEIKGDTIYGVKVYKGYTLNMHGGTITGGVDMSGNAKGSPTKFNMYGGTITGGVDMSGNAKGSPTKFNMYGGTITGGGVGVKLTESCEFTMSGGTISNNKSGVLTGSGTFTMSGGEISGNTATSNGGGVNIGNGGKFEMSGTAKITGNTAAYAGGGVYVSGGTFIMNGGEIKSNIAKTNGGGVHVTTTYGDSAFTMNGGEIKSNTANTAGGGVFVEKGQFTMSGTAKVTDNTVYSYGGGVFVNSGTTFTVSGTPTITDNTQGSDKNPNNVYLPKGKTITIGSDLTGSGNENPLIGVTTGDTDTLKGGKTVAITMSTPNANGYLSYFKSDNDSYYIQANSEETQLELKAKPKIDLSSATVTLKQNTFKFDSNSHTPEVDSVMLGGTKLTENTDYTVSVSSKINAGTYSLTITGIDKYEGSVTKTWTITPLIVNVSSVTLRDKEYDGTCNGNSRDVTSVTVKRGSSDSDIVTLKNGEYTIGSVTYADANAGTQNADIIITLAENGNYTFGGNQLTATAGTQGKITKASVNNLKAQTGEINVVNNKADTYTLNLNKLLPTLPDGCKYGEITYRPVSKTFTLGNYNGAGMKISDDGTLLILPIAAANDKKVNETICTGQVTAKTQNYTDITLFINIKAVAAPQKDPEYTAPTPKSDLVYTGTAQALINKGSATGGEMQYSLTSGSGYSTDIPMATNAGDYTVYYKVVGASGYSNTAVKSILVHIDKAKPTGEPIYTKITAAKKKLKDAALEPNPSWPTGTVKWALDDTTEVKADTAYKWIFTPRDSANYETLTGTVVLYTKSTPVTPSQPGGGSSGSGGGGGGSSSGGYDSNPIIKTETKNNPDGSTTKTETRKDGSVTQTTTGKDGSVSKTETKKDGSSVTENKAADGSTGTVKTDKNGRTTAETTLSSKAIEDAKKNGEAVKAPVEVKAARNSGAAPTVKVELPQNAGKTEVEIPVSNANAGTVAVLVRPDGTEEILKDSIPTEDGIRLTVDGSATVKIVDNAKDFIDTQNHWAKDEIDFVSARELVNGISATRYAPDATATRAQLWTILARQNDTDLSGGANWYEKAQLWSKDKGISDGTNPGATITRAQMVTMLWRTMGQPAATDKVSFADVPAGSYYAQAVAWAVENGITAGVGGGRFDPTATCTRAQIAAFLARSMK